MATCMDTLPAHLLPLVMEEFPHSLATTCVCRAGQREPRLRCVQCGIIVEEEEGGSTLEEDQAQRSFLQTVENLRRSTRWAPAELECERYVCDICLASLKTVWKPTDVNSAMATDWWSWYHCWTPYGKIWVDSRLRKWFNWRTVMEHFSEHDAKNKTKNKQNNNNKKNPALYIVSMASMQMSFLLTIHTIQWFGIKHRKLLFQNVFCFRSIYWHQWKIF